MPMEFKRDPGRHYIEDGLVGWSFNEYFNREVHDPETIILFPMVKACFRVMKAVEEFT